MKEAGWIRIQGESVFFMDLDDRRLISFATFLETREDFWYCDGGSVGFPCYSKIIEKINPKMTSINETIWLLQRRNSHFETPKASASFIIECTDELIKWASSIDPYEEIKKLAEHENIYEIYNHIAALALVGDLDRLNYFLHLRETEPEDAPFVPGSLHPLVKKEHIERAIALAQRLQKEPLKECAPAKS